MTDPTPEEKRAREAFEYMESSPDSDVAAGCLGLSEAWVRAAVAAEREAVVERVKIETVGWALSYAMYEDLLAAIRGDE